MHLSVFGRSIVLLSSPEVITDLLEKRGAIYSDRPILHFAGEMYASLSSFEIKC